MKILTLIFSLFLISSCLKTPISIEIDNPTNDEINLEIDNQKISIKPKTLIKFKTYIGEHNLVYEGKTENFRIYSDENDYLLNPTKSSYIIGEQFYLPEGIEKIDVEKINFMREILNNEGATNRRLMLVDTISIDSLRLIGFYKKDTTLLLRKIWDYGINEKLPKRIIKKYQNTDTDEVINFLDKFNGRKGKVKLYRKDDFLIELLEKSK